MIIIFLIILIITAVVGIATLSSSDRDDKFYSIYNLVLCTLVVIAMAIYYNSVKPIDVYRGKTTLEITYKNGVPIDSVVVYK